MGCDLEGRGRMLPAMRGKLLGVLLAVTILTGCSSGRDDALKRLSSSVSSSSVPSSSAPAIPTSTTNAAISCHPAPAAIVQLINAAFTDGETLTNPTSVDGPQDATYIAGDISEGGEIVSHADVWLSRHGALFALSSDARKRTILADGREIASAGDEYGTAATDCIAR